MPLPQSKHRIRAWLLIAVVLPTLLQFLALFNPDMVTLDCEERYNAGHALMLFEDHADAKFPTAVPEVLWLPASAIAGAGVMSLAGTKLAGRGPRLPPCFPGSGPSAGPPPRTRHLRSLGAAALSLRSTGSV